MILPPIVLARRALMARLQGMSKASGASFDSTFRRTLEDALAPQADVETYLLNNGAIDVQENITAADDETWVFLVGVTCSRAIANEETPIEDVIQIVMEDVRWLLLSDLSQGLPGICIQTTVGERETGDFLQQGYYGGTLSVRLTLRNRRPETF